MGHVYIFSFYKYAALIPPSLGRLAYVKDPRAESDGWRSMACSLCREFYEKVYREKAEFINPSTTRCHCKVCFRRLMTVKGAASDVAFCYVLNLEAYTMDSRIPIDRFKYIATCGRVSEDQLFSYTLPYRILANYLLSQDVDLRSHPKCLSNSPLPVHYSDWLQMIGCDKTWLKTTLTLEKTVLVYNMWHVAFDIKTGRYAGCALFYKF